jgi:hypothetical protein
VSDGLTFFLVNQQGGVEATASAHVVCGGSHVIVSSGPNANSYYPLAIGNTWVYKVNSRQETSAYLTQTITGTAIIGGKLYYVLTTEQTRSLASAYVRSDADGRVYQYNDTPLNPQDQLIFDPTAQPSQAVTTPLGTFPDAIQPTINSSLQRTTTTYARGVGLLKSESTLIAGSSGGFSGSLDLVEIRLADGLHLSLPASRLSLALPATIFDVTNRLVDNCAVPCYFVACGLVPGADPPNTYKPCTQARIEVSATMPYVATLELDNAQGQPVFVSDPLPGVPGQELHYKQLPLYSAPNQGFPAGLYRLTAHLSVGGVETSAAATMVEVR